MLIDGGPGQLAAAREVIGELGVDDMPVVGVAKGPDRDAGRERFFMPGASRLHAASRAIPCSISSSACATRPTASPSARTAPSARRRSPSQPLDEIAGIGPARKRALLQAFRLGQGGQPRRHRRSEGVEGISAQMAKTIYDHFHGR